MEGKGEAAPGSNPAGDGPCSDDEMNIFICIQRLLDTNFTSPSLRYFRRGAACRGA